MTAVARIAVIILMICIARAWSEPGTTGGILLREPFGARAFAMGQAYSALGDDVFGLAYNPALLSRLNQSQIATQFAQSLAGTQLGFVGIASPLSPRHAMGLNVAYLDTGKAPFYDINGSETGQLQAQRDISASLGYSRRIDLVGGRLHLGAAGKVLNSVLVEQVRATAFASDIGTVFEFARWGGLASIAAGASNLGPKIKYSGGLATGQSDPLGLTTHVGAAYALPVLKADAISFGAQINRVEEDETVIAGFGLEYDYRHLCALRIGYRTGQVLGGITMGLGLSIKGASIDYAIGLIDRFSDVQQVSLTYRFDVPGIRYGAPFILRESPVEAMGARVTAAMNEGRFFDAMGETRKLETVFPDASQVVLFKKAINQKVDSLTQGGLQSKGYQYALAFKAYESGNLVEALPLLESAVRRNPGSKELERALEDARERTKAAKDRQKLEQQARNATLFELADRAYQEGDSPRALKIVNTILGFGYYPPAENLRRRIDNDDRKIAAQKAKKAKSKKAKRAPKEPPLKQQRLAPDSEAAERLYNLSMQKYLSGDIEGAALSLQQASTLDPQNASIRNFLSSVEKARAKKTNGAPPQ